MPPLFLRSPFHDSTMRTFLAAVIRLHQHDAWPAGTVADMKGGQRAGTYCGPNEPSPDRDECGFHRSALTAGRFWSTDRFNVNTPAEKLTAASECYRAHEGRRPDGRHGRAVPPTSGPKLSLVTIPSLLRPSRPFAAARRGHGERVARHRLQAVFGRRSDGQCLVAHFCATPRPWLDLAAPRVPP